MAIAHDAATGAHSNGGSATHTVNHTPVGTPRAVLVITAKRDDSSDTATCTYGGDAMTEVTGSPNFNTESTGQNAHAWFLGAGIATGAQDAVVTWGSANDNRAMVIFTFTADGDCSVVATNAAQFNVTGNDPQTDTLALTSIVCAVVQMFTGNTGSAFSISPVAGWTEEYEEALGGDVYFGHSYVTIGSADVTIGFNSSNDVNYTGFAVAVREDAGGTTHEVALAAAASLGATQVADASFEPALTAALQLSAAMAGDAVFEGALTVAIQKAVSLVGSAVFERAITESIIANSVLTSTISKEVAMGVAIQMGFTSVSDATFEPVLSEGTQLAVNLASNAIFENAISFALQNSVVFACNAVYNVILATQNIALGESANFDSDIEAAMIVALQVDAVQTLQADFETAFSQAAAFGETFVGGIVLESGIAVSVEISVASDGSLTTGITGSTPDGRTFTVSLDSRTFTPPESSRTHTPLADPTDEE